MGENKAYAPLKRSPGRGCKAMLPDTTHSLIVTQAANTQTRGLKNTLPVLTAAGIGTGTPLPFRVNRNILYGTPCNCAFHVVAASRILNHGASNTPSDNSASTRPRIPKQFHLFTK